MAVSSQNISKAQDSSFSSEDVAEKTVGKMEEVDFKSFIQRLEDIHMEKAATLPKSPLSETQRRSAPFRRDGSRRDTRRETNLKLVLIGKTGDGKSATGNQILGRKGFKSTSCAKSVTPKCSTESCVIGGRKIMIVDTPGLFDTSKTNDEIKIEILKFIAITSPGPHAFLFTIGVGRYTEESKKTYKYVQKLLGNEADKHTIIVFTHKDDLEEEEKTVQEYVENIPTGLRSLLNNVGGKYVAVNNRLPLESSERLSQVKEILTLVDELDQANHGSVYSSDVYSTSESALKIKTKKEDDKVKNAHLKRAEAVQNKVEKKARDLERVKSNKNARASIIVKGEEELDSAVKEGKEEVKKIQAECEVKLEQHRDELRTDIMTDKVSVKEPWFASKLKKFKLLL